MSHVMNPENLRYETAVRDFRRARREAAMQQLLARVTGKSADLLAYNEVSERLKFAEGEEVGVREIPLEAIVGSVGRYQDFTRSFMPRSDQNAERWVRVKTAVNDMRGMPPIEVYKVGDAYFVIDGNHRVSVARQLGSETITARVVEVKARVGLSDHADATELICKERYLDFLEQTNLDRRYPEADLSMTFAGNYRALLSQIETQRARMAERRGEPIAFADAAAEWYEQVYLPIIRLVREQGVLRNFPERTEADMYILLSERRAELEEALEWDVDVVTAVSHLARTRSQTDLSERLIEALRPPGFADGPEPGQWRRELAALRSQHLFPRILIPIRGIHEDWLTFEQAVAVVRREEGQLLGLHVVESEDLLESAQAVNVQQLFEQRCREAGVPGELAIAAGSVNRTIIERAAFADLLVVNLMYPPRNAPIARRGSGFTSLIQRTPRPILAVPRGRKSAMKRALLAYDGSPKANEALFVAAYVAQRWGASLTVLTVETNYTTPEALELARAYLTEQGVTAVYELRPRPIADAVLETAVAHKCDLLIMGGFGFRPVQHMVLGSTVDRMLHEFRHPMLICR